jgi:hypothetical protein
MNDGLTLLSDNQVIQYSVEWGGGVLRRRPKTGPSTATINDSFVID